MEGFNSCMCLSSIINFDYLDKAMFKSPGHEKYDILLRRAPMSICDLITISHPTR